MRGKNKVSPPVTREAVAIQKELDCFAYTRNDAQKKLRALCVEKRLSFLSS